MTREEIAAEMREAVLDLFEEICKADGFDPPARDAGRRALDDMMKGPLSPDAAGVDWSRFEGMTAEKIRAITRAVFRPVVLRELAPMRPS